LSTSGNVKPHILHIFESSLHDKTGHCYSHIDSLIQADSDKQWQFHVWGGKNAANLFDGCENVLMHPVFSPAWRRMQEFFVFRKLLHLPGQVYLPTATRTHLLLLHWATRRRIPPSKFHLFFHWLRLSPSKRRFLQKISAARPELHVLAPTEGVAGQLKQCGFTGAKVLPYPITPVSSCGAEVQQDFSHLLFAGAARSDKGFGLVVDIVAELQRRQDGTPIKIQTSPPHKGTHEQSVASDIERLRQISYPHLVEYNETLDETQYMQMFQGAISLQVYDPVEYASERISGVTLDALSNGAPLIATADTWIGRIVDEHGAGVCVPSPDIEKTLAAVAEVRDNFTDYARRAMDAGKALQEQNSAGNILKYLRSPMPGA